jgi:hypothetical protein
VEDSQALDSLLRYGAKQLFESGKSGGGEANPEERAAVTGMLSSAEGPQLQLEEDKPIDMAALLYDEPGLKKLLDRSNMKKEPKSFPGATGASGDSTAVDTTAEKAQTASSLMESFKDARGVWVAKEKERAEERARQEEEEAKRLKAEEDAREEELKKVAQDEEFWRKLLEDRHLAAQAEGKEDLGRGKRERKAVDKFEPAEDTFEKKHRGGGYRKGQMDDPFEDDVNQPNFQPRPKEPESPAGWGTEFSKEHNKWYFYHLETKQSMWPEALEQRRQQQQEANIAQQEAIIAQQDSQPGAVEGRPSQPTTAGWVTHFDPTHRAWYYWHKETQTSRWDSPDAPPAQLAPAAGNADTAAAAVKQEVTAESSAAAAAQDATHSEHVARALAAQKRAAERVAGLLQGLQQQKSAQPATAELDATAQDVAASAQVKAAPSGDGQGASAGTGATGSPAVVSTLRICSC